MGLVPGLVLIAALATGSSQSGVVAWRRVRSRLLIYSAALSLGALSWVAAFPVSTHEEVSEYLVAHRQAGDTAVVAFGKPDILYGAEMSSPYPLLWSLPVRVLDPQLHELARLLASSDRPTWLVTGRSGLDGWGLHPSQSVLNVFARHYRPVAELDGLVVYLTRGRHLSLRGEDQLNPILSLELLGAEESCMTQLLTREQENRRGASSIPVARLAGILGYFAAIATWVALLGMPKQTVVVVGWIWLAVIAWDVRRPWREHLAFLRDWWLPLRDTDRLPLQSGAFRRLGFCRGTRDRAVVDRQVALWRRPSNRMASSRVVRCSV